MTNIFLILPNTLFQIYHFEKYFETHNFVYYEHPDFFTKFRFNRIKLVFHKATMFSHFEMMQNKIKSKIKYFKYNESKKFKLYVKNSKITYFDGGNNIDIKGHEIEETPLFIFTKSQLEKYKGPLLNSSFYKWGIKQIKIDIKKSYDKENRHSIPNDIKIPDNYKISNNQQIIKDAQKAIDDDPKFKLNYSSKLNDKYAINRHDALKILDEFIKTRLNNFGIYQDAFLENMEKNQLFHSGLSCYINIGLLEPLEIINKIWESNAPINSREGFIRQILSWREYQRLIYIRQYPEILKANYFNLKNKMPKYFYINNCKNKMDNPIISTCVKSAWETGYLHHILRLMVIANYMTLLEINPYEVYKWFMEFSIDSYEWVMCQNVFGMGTYASQNASKPYLSSSNYILKMSNFKKNNIWDHNWDALFYKFILKHEKKLSKTIYIRNISYFKKLSKSEQNEKLKIKN